MARLPRVVIPNTPHYVAQQSVRSIDLFMNDEDRLMYLKFMKQQGSRLGVKFLAYCLLNDQVHMVAVPNTQEGLGRCIGEAHRLYTRRINERENTRGYLFQGRFQSCAIEENNLFSLMHLVEFSPVRLGVSESAKLFQWSSARYHLGLVNEDSLVQSAGLQIPNNWREVLAKDLENREIFFSHFRSGRPLGSDSFIQKAATLTGVDLSTKRRGRPKKEEVKII